MTSMFLGIKLKLTNFQSSSNDVLLGVSAAFYFATYLYLPNGLSAVPFVIIGLFLFARHFFIKSVGLERRDLFWVLALLSFGLWGCFTIWFHEGAENLYDEPLHFVLGSVIAFSALRYRVDIFWIKLGVVLSSLALIAWVFSSYNGGRFAPTMNATKFGNAIAFQAALAVSLAVLSHGIWQRGFLVALALANSYVVTLTGTRGAMVALVVYFVLLALFFLRSLSLKQFAVGGLLFLIAATFVANTSLVSSRLQAAQHDFSKISQGNYSSSIGYRIIMYKAGLQAGIEHPITGAGYDYNRIFENFDAKTDAQNLVAQKVGKDFQNFHSLYIDTLAKRGFVGVLLLGLVLLAAFYSRNRDIMVLTLAPTAIIAGAGLTDSVFELGITTSYFVIATTIIKSIRFA
jgi:O-antigen ligase